MHKQQTLPIKNETGKQLVINLIDEYQDQFLEAPEISKKSIITKRNYVRLFQGFKKFILMECPNLSIVELKREMILNYLLTRYTRLTDESRERFMVIFDGFLSWSK